MNLAFNPLSLRVRTFAVLVVLLGALVVALLLLANTIFAEGFRQVEAQSVTERVEQAANALADSLTSLERVTRDYAIWDDSYAFVSAPDQTYIDNNLMDATFINNHLSYVGFVNRAGEVVVARAFNLAEETEAPVPSELLRFDGANAFLLQHASVDTRLGGLLMLADGPMLIAAHPILTSLGEGPPAGTLVMGRWLDANELARLREVTRLPLNVARFDDPALPADLRSLAETITPEQPVAVTALDEQRIRGITHVPDLYGGPGALLTLDLPREIHQLGRQTSYTYTLVLIGAGLLLTATVFWMLERIVLARIIGLSNEVAAVDHNQPEAQVSIIGNDEIGRLGDAINTTLRRLAQARQQLAENERRYRQLIELSPDAVLVHDGKNIHYANAAAALLLGSDGSASLIGQPVHPAIGAVAPHSNGTPVLVDRQLTQPDGATIEVELVVLPFHDRGVPAIQTIIRNITERKQVEHALRAAKEAADAANLAKSRFLATMSHELRTPLTAILGYTELLERTLATTVPAETMKDLASIRMAGNHLLAIINDILDLSKIEAGMMQIRPNPLAVAPLIQRVVDTVQAIATRNRNRIVVQTADAVPMVVSDELRLQQILVNLVGNACKFTEDGTVTIEVSGQPAGDGRPAQVSFAIHDTGIGISPEHLKDLFHDFVQVDSSSTRKYGGTGLGLALSQRLARLLGGEISVVSTPGVGSTFTLTLPQSLEVPCEHVSRSRLRRLVMRPKRLPTHRRRCPAILTWKRGSFW
ncbi:MAG: ATP-binding protein [Chloroflexaceae bacterium]|nr:ATP-binding protein [Chloroflexaceae bacterium]